MSITNAPEECCADLKQKFDGWTRSTETAVRKEPMESMALAFLGGALLSILPMGKFLGIFVALVLKLARPALLLLGAMKALEEMNRHLPVFFREEH